MTPFKYSNITSYTGKLRLGVNDDLNNFADNYSNYISVAEPIYKKYIRIISNLDCKNSLNSYYLILITYQQHYFR
jgi:hypothetical protein